MPDHELRTRSATSLDDPAARYRPLDPGSTTLPAGHRHERGALRLSCAIVHDRDVAITLRDGTTIYADVFRPATTSPVPAIVNWAPYGKAGTGFWTLDNSSMFPNRFGIKRSQVSGLQSWEGNDPAYWCAHGYAVVQVDARGVFNSEGVVQYLSATEGRDGHDAVEAVAALPWCSGRIGLAGNSWLAMSQWRTASERPPHLAAIAPWEGLTDVYRDVLARGGVPAPAFPAFIRDTLYGAGEVEDPVAMLEDHPLVDDYWDSKLPDITAIEVPAYVVASYSNRLHTEGTLRNWAALRSPSWLRIHNTQEWPDFYDPAHVEDLRRFFDHHLLDVDNGWTTTAPVRMAVLDPGNVDTVDRACETYPPSGTTPTTFFLDARSSHRLADEAPQQEVRTGYALADPEPVVDFTHRFDRTTELLGQAVLTLWVSVEGHDDADLWAQVQKLDARGRQVLHQTVTLGLPLARRWMPIVQRRGVAAVAPAFHGGPEGIVRISRRGLDPDAAPPFQRLALREEHRLGDDEVVEVTIPFWPTAWRWQAGEQLRLRVSPRPLSPSELPGLAEEPLQPGTAHVLHTGGRYASRLELPLRT